MQKIIEVDSFLFVAIEDEELTALRAEIQQLNARLAELETASVHDAAKTGEREASSVAGSAASRSPMPPKHPATRTDEGRGSDRRPVRAVVLDVLDDTGVPTYSREISQLIAALYGRNISSTRFGALSADEERAHVQGRPRSVYLGHALTAERFEPIKRLWVRSDWPLTERVMAPTTSRTRHLRMTMKLCDLAHTYSERAADPVMLKILAADHAVDLPGVKVRRGEFPLGEWHATAAELLAELGPRDADARTDAAKRLADLGEHHQLFGPPQIIAVSDNEQTITDSELRRRQ